MSIRSDTIKWFKGLSGGRHQYPIKGIPTTEELAEWRTEQILSLLKAEIEKMPNPYTKEQAGAYVWDSVKQSILKLLEE